ncbi:hypothetical protein R75461_08403 [Paraburkholderia nemoris]|uniref:hypothetical protein n=1 Tax=Paraburkholderia nemoris TaxID=2793076 RepID=UPI00190C9A76|nr:MULTISPECIES: hypothetical protein [Paraburkholderia]MBK3787171.1 hypothetical protein [Paraburkholderia aspalathi]CAE6867991.1 hypothetical protein R75461_08403 [Paraburkholderia nemoris]
MANQLTPLQAGISSIESAYPGAAQSVSAIVTMMTNEATRAMSGVASSLETAVSGLVT